MEKSSLGDEEEQNKVEIEMFLRLALETCGM